MPAFLKPDNLNIVWSSGGDRLYPGDTKYSSGWGVEIPPRQYFNEIDYKQDQMLAHINQRGIAEWDVTTEYQGGKSYTQDSTGTIHRCILTHSGQNPESDVSNTYWEVAFANAGEFYTKSEVYTKTEVDTKTKISTTLQAQEQSSNSVLLTPLRLADAFSGTNKATSATSGKQKLPGGFVISGGYSGGTTSDSFNLIFPQAFPTRCISIVTTPQGGSALTTDVSYAISNLTATGCVVTRIGASTTVEPFYWIAIGE